MNISLSDSVEEAIIKLAERDNVPEATKAIELIKIALEMEEDNIWDRIATKRLETDNKRISHKDAWK
ncbi:MAG: hypothetical protein COV57_01595 [Candidatus Liptonbacteria bacterium CG11_big_fil_rev_8_21_14_0_20_35_14]|uniref:Antitoxin, RHH family protein n=1 Tax=Candidatus Liptonbacteria bacterium CG11_big_fil_rev_8_21_14_0_20_35_14 TaxID=1974634 RepID=A0A2H0N7T3_9BACT|nr:MAG: hypothetical protein COV57_01595 [Candidatus Liptonbacteria bacterium CG11_big_fil_rev_8_21_14_0_20_35_14]